MTGRSRETRRAKPDILAARVHARPVGSGEADGRGVTLETRDRDDPNATTPRGGRRHESLPTARFFRPRRLETRRPAVPRAGRRRGPGPGLVPHRSTFGTCWSPRGVYNPKLKLPLIPVSDAAGEVVAMRPGRVAVPGRRPGGRLLHARLGRRPDRRPTRGDRRSAARPTGCWRRRSCSPKTASSASPIVSASRRRRRSRARA